jgi:type VI protein secretion system component VasF
MSKDFEQQLHEALRQVDPEEGFEQRVMARIAQERSRTRTKVTRWVSVALAASVAFAAMLGTHEWQMRREQEGLEARKQLLEALRLTGEKLDVAYQAVNREAAQPTDDGSGA